MSIIDRFSALLQAFCKARADQNVVELTAEITDLLIRIQELEKDKARLDWLDKLRNGGVNHISHRGPDQQGHLYYNERWVPMDPAKPDGARRAEFDHAFAKSIRAVIDKGMAGVIEPMR